MLLISSIFCVNRMLIHHHRTTHSCPVVSFHLYILKLYDTEFYCCAALVIPIICYLTSIDLALMIDCVGRLLNRQCPRFLINFCMRNWWTWWDDQVSLHSNSAILLPLPSTMSWNLRLPVVSLYTYSFST